MDEEETGAARHEQGQPQGLGPSASTPVVGITATPAATGFVFASGKKVELGADALEKGRQFWAKVDEEETGAEDEAERPDMVVKNDTEPGVVAAAETSNQFRACTGGTPIESSLPATIPLTSESNGARQKEICLSGEKDGMVYLSLGEDLLKRSDGRVSLSHVQNICDGFVCEDDMQSQRTSEMTKRCEWVAQSGYTALFVTATESFQAHDFLEALERFFKADVDLNLTLLWVQNHLKWVLWKFVAYTLRFSKVLRSSILTPEHVLGQLKHRFRQENYMGKRSPLFKILSLQARTAPSKLVLFVSATHVGGDTGMIELSDGWYSLPAKLDYTLQRHLSREKIFLGLKIAVCGAELLGVEDPCQPLDRPAAACMQLSVNGVRPAPWDAKLGFSGRMNIRMHSIVPGGGIVPATVVVIQAQYPLMVFEKTPDGAGKFRSLQNEEKARSEWNDKRASIAEKVQEKFEARLTQPTNEAGFNDLAEDFRKEVSRAHISEGVDERRVSTFLRVRVKSLSHAGRRGDCRTSAVVSIWRPAEHLIHDLLPGKTFQVTNLNTNVHQRLNQPLQLQATHSTQWLPANESHSGFSQLVCSYAMPTPIPVTEAMKLENAAEFDFVGAVVHRFHHQDRGKDWLFMTDDTSCAAAEDLVGKGMPFLGNQPIMLALEIERESEGSSIAANAKKGQVLSFNNIVRGVINKKESCLNCCATEMSSCMRVPRNDALRSQRAASILEFVSQNVELLDALEGRCMSWGRE